jgi:4-carboxymuconolactone decarboxylase
MRSFRILMAVLFALGASVTAGSQLDVSSAQTDSNSAATQSRASATTFPKDIHAETGNRLPEIKREDLDEAAKKLYDTRRPGGAYGPGALRLYSPSVEQYMSDLNDYLRNKSGLDPRLVELAILVTAREMDCEYVWTAHEPAGLKAGLSQETIDVVKYRKALNGVGEKEAAIIQLGRESIGKHKVSSETAAHALNLFGNQGVVNFAALMGDYASTAILLGTFDQHVRPTNKPLLPLP